MGFERFNKGIYSNFSYINRNITNSELQQKYYEKRMQEYSVVSKRNNKVDILEWAIRIRKSLKEIFTSALFYCESEKSKEYGCFASTYYLRYYSLFHAMLSNLFLDERQSINELMEITHTKVVNCFRSNYCTNKFPIINNKIKEDFNMLKFMREYYSYTMPMNEIFNYGDGSYSTNINLKEDIIQCFQLANFSVVCIENSFSKNFHKSLTLDTGLIGLFHEMFIKVNGKKNSINNELLLDDADNNEYHEILKYGISIYNYNLDLEHFCDEFRSYRCMNMGEQQEKLYDNLTSDAIRLVYEAIA